MSQDLSSREKTVTEELLSLLAMRLKHARGSNAVSAALCWERRLYTLPQSSTLRTLNLLMAGLMVISSNSNEHKTII
jgi:hypothetical protein